jgi:predicted alpha/beta superfamily hydrolase
MATAYPDSSIVKTVNTTRSILAIVLCSAGLATGVLLAQQAPKTLTLASPILQEDRRILVRLPRNYDKDTAARYPVLYKLDGDNDLERYHNTIDVLSSTGAIPDMLVVAIPNGRAKRDRDLTPPFLHYGDGETGQGDKFLNFIEKELIPNIDATYRTDPRQRLFAGQEKGAALVLYSLVAKPQLFQARFSFSAPASIEDQRLVTELRTALRKAAPRGFLYCTWGSDEDDKSSQGALQALFTKQAPKTLRWITDTTRDADLSQSQFRGLPTALFEFFAPTAKRSPRR